MPGDTRHFDEIDRLLNETVCGPRWLAEPDIAAAVAAALDYHADTLNHFKLHAWVVMPNHIHALASPLADPAALLQSLKGDTARQANHLLGRPGAPFWDREHHEQWVRNRKEWNQVILRIESDPVRAGLARSPDEYPWSSAARLLPAA